MPKKYVFDSYLPLIPVRGHSICVTECRGAVNSGPYQLFSSFNFFVQQYLEYQHFLKLIWIWFVTGLFFPKKTYKEPVLIGEGAFVDVLVTHVVSPDEFYVQKVSTSLTFYAVEIPPIQTTSHVPVFEWVVCYSLLHI